MRPALRVAALMQIHAIFIFTHDSIGLGEDGPTHQPIEHLMSLRAMPGMTIIRPADANETSAAWRVAVKNKDPVILVLTRQKLPVLNSKKYSTIEGVAHGAYILAEAKSKKPDIIIIATGSEVHLALDVRKKLTAKGIQARVVSMPSWELFEKQSIKYKKKILLSDVPKLAVEAGSTMGWYKYVGENGDVIGIDRFGASGRGDVVLEKFGFSVENITKHAETLLRRA